MTNIFEIKYSMLYIQLNCVLKIEFKILMKLHIYETSAIN